MPLKTAAISFISGSPPWGRRVLKSPPRTAVRPASSCCSCASPCLAWVAVAMPVTSLRLAAGVPQAPRRAAAHEPARMHTLTSDDAIDAIDAGQRGNRRARRARQAAAGAYHGSHTAVTGDWQGGYTVP